MGTDLVLWLQEKANSLVLDGETLTWVAETKAHLERCRETGEDPFPAARPAAEVIAELRARFLPCPCPCHTVVQPGLVPCPQCSQETG